MKLLATQAPAATAYACPMHPEVVRTSRALSQVGMKLLATAAPTSYVCPMHPEVTSDQPGRCPKCGMKLLAAESVPKPAAAADAAAMDEHGGHAADHDHRRRRPRARHRPRGSSGKTTWSRSTGLTTTATMHWKFLDRTSGADSPAIDWHFTVGERVKIRLVNEMDSDHPMHHPFHLHGAGRFLVLARDGVPEPNLVWKDTVLVRTGQVVDILFDVTNPGLWMAHCHIAEHMQSGMMFSFNVARDQAVAHDRPHDEAHKDPAGDQRLDVVVVGGSQAGLAMAWHLAQQGRRFVVLEAAPELGQVWRSRWDSLKLFTPAQYDALPGMAFPAPADTYPTKDPVADYLQAYAKRLRPAGPAQRPGHRPAARRGRASRSAPPMPPTGPGRWWWPPARSRSPSSHRRPAGSTRR